MKRFLLAFLFAGSLSNVYCQDFNIGVRGGFDFSRVTNTDTNAKFGSYIGIFVPFKLSEKFTLQPEYNFIGQGAKGSYGVHQDCYVDDNGQVICPPDKTVDIKGRTYYHSFGVYNKYAIAKQCNIGLGVSLDLKTKKSSDFEGPNDIALTAGVEFYIFKGFQLEMRFKKGFNDVVEPRSVVTENFHIGENNYNIVAQIGIAYVFNIRKAPTQSVE